MQVKPNLDFTKDPKLPNRYGTTQGIKSNEEQGDSSAILKVVRIRKNMQIPDLELINSDDPHQQTNETCFNNPNSDHSRARVSSTADFKPLISSQRPPFTITRRGILLHKPPRPSTSADKDQDNSSSNCNANFTLTEDYLSPIIGQRSARNFLRYYRGSNSFNSRCHVYYRPSPKLLAKISETAKTFDLTSSSSSESDDDVFEMLARYGAIHTVFENCRT